MSGCCFGFRSCQEGDAAAESVGLCNGSPTPALANRAQAPVDD